MAITKEVVQKYRLSRFLKKNLSEQMKNFENCGPAKVKMKTSFSYFFDKTHYLIFYKLQNFYVKLGLIVTNLYRIVMFKQEMWLELYSKNKTNSERQKMFEEALKKSMINLNYGKLCETKRKRMILRDAGLRC